MPRIDQYPHPLADDDHRITTEDRVRKQRNTPQQAEPPERHRHHDFALPFRGYPLHQNPGGEKGLTQEADC
jgi:hypothetical protein